MGALPPESRHVGDKHSQSAFPVPRQPDDPRQPVSTQEPSVPHPRGAWPSSLRWLSACAHGCVRVSIHGYSRAPMHRSLSPAKQTSGRRDGGNAQSACERDPQFRPGGSFSSAILNLLLQCWQTTSMTAISLLVYSSGHNSCRLLGLQCRLFFGPVGS